MVPQTLWNRRHRRVPVVSSRSFSLVSGLQSSDQEEEVAGMLRDLSRLLLQPLDSLVVPTRQSEVQLVLIVQPPASEEKKTGEL